MQRSDADVVHLREAIALSLRGAGQVSPNPLVGAVVVREGIVVGRGWHERFGAPHAEVNALRDAGAQARGATLYVTLEPCCHRGKTPPCTEAILEAGIARVVYACADPNPVACGGGARLEAQGVSVTAGLCAEEAFLANAAYHKWIRTGLPLVHAKLAASLDGRITGPGRRGDRITGDEAREAVFRLRAEADAVLVGSGTVLADDPLLSPRGERGAIRPGQPLRVVLDSRGRVPGDCRVVATATPEQPVAVLVGPEAPRAGWSERPGLERVDCPLGPDGRLDLAEALRRLGARPVLSVLVEAGTAATTALLRAGLVDRVSWFLAPLLVGAQGQEALSELGLAGIASAPGLERVAWEEVGRDLRVNGWLPGLPWFAP